MNVSTQHEPTDRCLGQHCYSHNIDEPDDRAYIVCVECGHVYRTAFELWRRYINQSARIFAVDIRRPKGGITVKGFHGGDDVFLPFTPPPFARVLAPWFLLRSLFRRPSRITFCQHCIHDF
ncbi:hypothetical protein ACFFG4_06855 [Micromonospora costi]